MPTEEYPQLDVIAVGAHPDDVEIACGGSLTKLVKQGYLKRVTFTTIEGGGGL